MDSAAERGAQVIGYWVVVAMVAVAVIAVLIAIREE
jgi:hypothetical protein